MPGFSGIQISMFQREMLSTYINIQECSVLTQGLSSSLPLLKSAPLLSQSTFGAFGALPNVLFNKSEVTVTSFRAN